MTITFPMRCPGCGAPLLNWLVLLGRGHAVSTADPARYDCGSEPCKEPSDECKARQAAVKAAEARP